ncbi:hypothetical protein CE91St46_07370 [Eubacteriales bacterium]|nr:hypothetical protein CE91St46_07370 [Eubacteriales bacterium]GKH62267.1 hypothetical protein CE91St47_07360 [Eubacteriales bacterium]
MEERITAREYRILKSLSKSGSLPKYIDENDAEAIRHLVDMGMVKKVTLPEKREESFDNSGVMFDKKAEEKHDCLHRYLRYGRLVLEGLVFFGFGLLVSYALKFV